MKTFLLHPQGNRYLVRPRDLKEGGAILVPATVKHAAQPYFEVLRCGPEATKYKPGDRVLCNPDQAVGFTDTPEGLVMIINEGAIFATYEEGDLLEPENTSPAVGVN